ncbi:hypothetical protein H4R20_001886 [Coemansia guatemalensis]|uniref:ER membrane protein complex subunit 1 n=1 Tax=Coemansia guatemalensis TaxID=2761395 RepID=A0A9W8HYP8_9FUNG|nr:hypothetical protein H4R20_001886 [Coemansia guatemalensis]
MLIAWRVLKAVVAVSSVLSGAQALFPDEAGRIDWYQAQIGVPQRLEEHVHNGTVGLVAATARNVVALVDAESGALRWRQQLGDEAIGALQVRDGRVLTQSAAVDSAAQVRVWDADSGALQWSFTHAADDVSGGAAAFVDDSDDVVTVSGNQLVRVAADGSTAWTLALNGTGVYGRVVVHGGSVFAVGDARRTRTAGRRLHVVEARVATGEVVQQYDVADGQRLGNGRVVVAASRTHGGFVVWREKKNIVWQLHRLGQTSPLWEMHHAKHVQMELMPEDMLSSTLVEAGAADAPRFAMAYTKDGVAKTLVVELVRGGDGVEMRRVALVSDRTDGVAWRTGDETGEARKGRVAYRRDTYGPVTGVTVCSGAARVVVQTRGGLVAALAHGRREPVWLRDEALAHAQDMAFVDLPAPASPAEHAARATDPSVLPSPFARFVLHWVAWAQTLRAWALTGFGLRRSAATAPPAGTESGRLAPEPLAAGDHFGFSKLAVFGSSTGVVTAVGTQGGVRSWAHYVAHNDSPAAVERVIVTRRSLPVGGEPPVAVAVGRGARNHTVVAPLDALTGAPLADLGQHVMPFAYSRVLELPATDPESGQLLLGFVPVDGAPRLVLWPPTTSAARAFCALTKPFFFEVGDDVGSTRVRGFRAVCPDAWAPDTPPEVDAQPAWSFDLPPGETLVAAARYEPGGYATALQGRVLGDRSVRYKYINPHLMTLATQGPDGVAVYLIDRVSGRLLHSATHAAARVDKERPFLAVQSESRVIYQLWLDAIPAAAAAPPARGFVTVVAELFESDRADERTTDSAISSRDLRLPSVVTEAFAAPEPATALAVTRTRARIATRDVLFALSSGKLLALPDQLLDARRPLAPSADEKAEGLLPYAAPLPLDPRRVVSHHNAVASVRRIVSHPTDLESTALVAAFGLDVFFTRLSPSGVFDQLAPTFSKANLVITTLALAVGCLLARPMVHRKLTNRAWA